MVNLDNPKGDHSVLAATIFTIVAFIVGLLRLFVRVKIVQYVGAEDYLVALAMVMSIGVTVTMKIQDDHGLGLHFADINPDDKVVFLEVCASWKKRIRNAINNDILRAFTS
jgi:uncharacterized protein YebE (UPF0316 family)